ncbi:hypothetical protein BC827DRAFT_353645 [Russula dissimulans]|nr:hypothetical protein BC827DRAFT_353645 [Russula dissimulans]
MSWWNIGTLGYYVMRHPPEDRVLRLELEFEYSHFCGSWPPPVLILSTEHRRHVRRRSGDLTDCSIESKTGTSRCATCMRASRSIWKLRILGLPIEGGTNGTLESMELSEHGLLWMDHAHPCASMPSNSRYRVSCQSRGTRKSITCLEQTGSSSDLRATGVDNRGLDIENMHVVRGPAKTCGALRVAIRAAINTATVLDIAY